MTHFKKCREVDKLFYDYFPKSGDYDMIAQHYAEIMGASLAREYVATSVCDLFKFFSSNPNAEELENYYQAFFKSSNAIIYKLSTNHADVLQEFLKFQVYLGLLNLVMDNGLYFENIINNIKKTYKKDWLEIISKADKENLSVDGAKNKKSEQATKFNDDIKKYLIFKKWKDKLHSLYMDTDEICSNYITKIIGNQVSGYEVFFELIKYLLEKKYSKGIVSIEELTFLVRGYYFFPFVRKNFGGKAFGLALLNENGIKIPETYVISVNCEMVDYSIFSKEKKYAVRSSADIEDGDKHSFAGMFDSFLDVQFKDLEINVQKVKDSIHSQRLNSYLKQLNLFEPKMAVIIQEYRPCQYAGVFIGKDLTTGGLEWVQGNGEKLVSGNVTPNFESYTVGEDVCNHLTINDLVVAKSMLEAQQKIYRQTQKLADIEWCVCENELIFLQYRTVTAQVEIKNVNSNTELITGVACSKGVVVGRAVFVENPEKLNEWNEDNILFVVYTSPEWITLMLKAKAIITCYGGFFSHAGIIAREFGIPCVSGIGERIQELDGKMVKVNGDTGEIEILE